MSMMSLPAGAQAPPGGPPPGLMQLIAASQQGGQPDDDSGSNDGGLSALQDVITDMAKLLHQLTDPGDVAAATQAMHILTKIQARLMAQGQGASSGASAQGQ